MYIPSEKAGDCRGSSTGETVVSARRWPTEKSDLIAGDLNAHSTTWDSSMLEEAGSHGIDASRGNLIDEWLEDNNMVVLNNGKSTHTSRKTGRESTPDLTIVHGDSADQYDWEVLGKLGASDHNPIMITRVAEGINTVNDKPRVRWDLKNANYEEFRNQVENELPEGYEGKSIHKLEKILRKAVNKAAEENIGKKTAGSDARPGYSKEVKEEIEARNQLKKKVKEEGGRKRWIDKCREVREMMRKEKEANWKEYVENLDAKTNPKQVWATIRNLDGRIAPRKDNEVLVVEGKGLVNDKDKANAFAKTYKKVSRIPRGPSDRTIKRKNRQFLNNNTREKNHYEEDLTWEELERAINDTKNNKAPGEDTIPHDIIKQLGPKARKFILHIFNRIWQGEPIPQGWRTAIIKPLLKEGKDPKSTGSYRPISLTDCLGKLLEKIIADRLSAYLEENGMLNEHQAGFRKERCTTDQIHKLVQMAADRIQEKGDELSTVVTFFDFQWAYDKVWREGLISKMIEMNIPYSFVKYTRLFLSARKTTVEVNGTRSNYFYLNEGLPQGSAISPLLFIIFINDIT